MGIFKIDFSNELATLQQGPYKEIIMSYLACNVCCVPQKLLFLWAGIFCYISCRPFIYLMMSNFFFIFKKTLLLGLFSIEFALLYSLTSLELNFIQMVCISCLISLQSWTKVIVHLGVNP